MSKNMDLAQYTKEEFMDLLVKVDYGCSYDDVNKNNPLNTLSCPDDIGLIADDEICANTLISEGGCKICWKDAIKDIKFKGES